MVVGPFLENSCAVTAASCPSRIPPPPGRPSRAHEKRARETAFAGLNRAFDLRDKVLARQGPGGSNGKAREIEESDPPRLPLASRFAHPLRSVATQPMSSRDSNLQNINRRARGNSCRSNHEACFRSCQCCAATANSKETTGRGFVHTRPGGSGPWPKQASPFASNGRWNFRPSNPTLLLTGRRIRVTVDDGGRDESRCRGFRA